MYREDGPPVRYRFQSMTAAVVERESGSEHKRRDRTGDQDFVRSGIPHDSRRYMYRDAMHIAVLHFDLTRMQSAAHLSNGTADRVDDDARRVIRWRGRRQGTLCTPFVKRDYHRRSPIGR